MTNSRYVKITENIILEYIYYNEAELTIVGNEWVKSSSNDTLLYLENFNDNSIQIFNGDNSNTGNVRDRSYTTVNNSGKYALLDIDKILFYNDFDDNVTNTVDLPLQFNNNYDVVYDKVRLHLAQNFDFSGFDGFVFDLSVTKQNTKSVYLTRFVYNSYDNFETLNPEPFVFGEKFYASYIDLYIPSFNKLLREYYLEPLNGETPTEQLSNFKGWDKNGFLKFSFGWIEDREKIESQDYIYVYRRKEAALPIRDPFEVISAVVEESESGDYIEMYGQYNGGSIDTFMNDLNTVNGNDYIIIHDIVVSEYIGNGLNTQLNNGSWVITTIQSISQTEGFDQPILYRPIIKNSESAIAYKIDYIARFFDRNSNTQFWKRASLVSFEVRKYGKKLSRIDLGVNQTPIKIYNTIAESSYTLNIEENLEQRIQYINSYISTNSIAVSFTTTNLTQYQTSNNTVSTLLDSGIVAQNKSFDTFGDTYTNGKLKLLVPDSSCFIRFVVKDYIESSGALRIKDLSSTPDIYLRFYRSDNSYIEVPLYRSSTDDITKGEISFDMSSEIIRRIKGFKGRNFNIVSKESNIESVLYTGKFLLQDEYIEFLETNEVDMLKKEVQEKSVSINTLNTQISDLNNSLTTIKDENINLRASIDLLQRQLEEARIKLDETRQLDVKTSKNIQNTTDTVNNLIKTVDNRVNAINTKQEVKIKANNALPFKKRSK